MGIILVNGATDEKAIDQIPAFGDHTHRVSMADGCRFHVYDLSEN